MLYRSLVSVAALWLLGCASTSNDTAPAPIVVSIFAVDYADLSAEAASACERRAPGTGERIRAAHQRWQAQHLAAQQSSLQTVEDQVRSESAQQGQAFVPFSQRRDGWRAQSIHGLRVKMAALDDAAIKPYCERWPALFDQPDMQFALMAASTPQRAQPPRNFMLDHEAQFTEAARLCEARAPGSGAAVSQALARWQVQHGAAKDKLIVAVHAQAQARADAVGGRVLTLDSMRSWQRARAIGGQQQLMQGLTGAAVRPYCESLPREFDRADMNFNAQWEATQRLLR